MRLVYTESRSLVGWVAREGFRLGLAAAKVDGGILLERADLVSAGPGGRSALLLEVPEALLARCPHQRLADGGVARVLLPPVAADRCTILASRGIALPPSRTATAEWRTWTRGVTATAACILGVGALATDLARDSLPATPRVQTAAAAAVDSIGSPVARGARAAAVVAVLDNKVENDLRQAAYRARPAVPVERPAAVPASAARRARKDAGIQGAQEALGLRVDGKFGEATVAALTRWQEAHGLAADATVGPETRASLDLPPGPTLEPPEPSEVAAVIGAADRIATLPYLYGGGHGSFDDSAYDCSGSVSYALHGAGLLEAPMDSGSLMTYGEPGPGRHVTIYANSGHVYMTVNGRRFDTSARSLTGSRWTAVPRSSGGYVARHPTGL